MKLMEVLKSLFEKPSTEEILQKFYDNQPKALDVQIALLCSDCDTIYNNQFECCPKCTNSQFLYLSSILSIRENPLPLLYSDVCKTEKVVQFQKYKLRKVA